MAEGLATADGQVLDLGIPAEAPDTEREFAQTMAAPGGADKAPPKRRARAPKDDPAPAARARKGPVRKAEQRATAPASREQVISGVTGLCQIGAAIPAMLARSAKAEKARVAWQADAITIASAAPEIARACADTAEADPRFAAVLARITQAGPYAALITVAFGVGSQLARNHGMAALPGTHDPAALVAMAQPQETADGTAHPVAA